MWRYDVGKECTLLLLEHRPPPAVLSSITSTQTQISTFTICGWTQVRGLMRQWHSKLTMHGVLLQCKSSCCSEVSPKYHAICWIRQVCNRAACTSAAHKLGKITKGKLASLAIARHRLTNLWEARNLSATLRVAPLCHRGTWRPCGLVGIFWIPQPTGSMFLQVPPPDTDRVHLCWEARRWSRLFEPVYNEWGSESSSSQQEVLLIGRWYCWYVLGYLAMIVCECT